MADPTLHLPARDIPVPTSISPEAQALLSGFEFPAGPDEPETLDPAAWRDHVRGNDDMIRSLLGDRSASWAGNVTERVVGGCTVYLLEPTGVDEADRRTYFDIHGGSWVFGGGDLCRSMATTTADTFGVRTWAVDYRMPPDHPHPTPLEDCLAAYAALLEERRPEEIVVGGTSAGANLAAALLVRLKADGLPLPAALVLNTGAFDLTCAGDSWRTNFGLDNVLRSNSHRPIQLYAGATPLDDRYLSPLFADLTGLPPTIILTGTRDLLLSDNVRMHRALLAAGVDAQLHVWEAAAHGGFLGAAPEDADRSRQQRRFAEQHWRPAS